MWSQVLARKLLSLVLGADAGTELRPAASASQAVKQCRKERQLGLRPRKQSMKLRCWKRPAKLQSWLS